MQTEIGQHFEMQRKRMEKIIQKLTSQVCTGKGFYVEKDVLTLNSIWSHLPKTVKINATNEKYAVALTANVSTSILACLQSPQECL